MYILAQKKLNPTRYIVLGFGGIILLGTLLLRLPIAAWDGQATPWLVCLFTATSATCVTGLVLVDTALHWTPFGQGVMLVLVQLGGLGFVTLMSLVPFALHRRIGLSQRMMMASSLNMSGVAGVVRVVRHALMGTFLAEGLGAALLPQDLSPFSDWVGGCGSLYSTVFLPFVTAALICSAGTADLTAAWRPSGGTCW